MIKVVGIRFQRAGKIYYFDPLDYDLETAMHVIVETARGVEMGTVLIPPKEVDDDKVVQPLKPVIRIATDDDEKVIEKNKEKEAEAYVICKEKIAKHGLDMKLVAAEYTFDNNKLLFYFTADGRIDFRELVKDLASVFRTRIELRQIGVRDETKMLGGIGICGRELCCRSYLTDFVPVSKGTESVLKSDKNFGCMRQTHVLSEERAGNIRILKQPSAVGGRFGNHTDRNAWRSVRG
mgnify:CR=1 FL=1